MRTCTTCMVAKPITEYNRFHKGKGGYSRRCRLCANKYKRALYHQDGDYNRAVAAEKQVSYNARIREEALTVYGGKCACCGETNYAFLVLDHINGGGTQWRKAQGKAGGARVYAELKRAGWPTGIVQVLCANCNMAKERKGGCPHRINDRKKGTVGG